MAIEDGQAVQPATVAVPTVEWHSRGMARTRVSTTVDDELLTRARAVTGEIDRAYAAYDAHPVDEADEWGDLASFRAAAAAS